MSCATSSSLLRVPMPSLLATSIQTWMHAITPGSWDASCPGTAPRARSSPSLTPSSSSWRKRVALPLSSPTTLTLTSRAHSHALAKFSVPLSTLLSTGRPAVHARGSIR
eukprot:Mycagemm_TRINITY_DN10231_c0_g1::TRINITY_DN10231_c0_g1_i1::g.3792::m.3792 type:complete len:109 gc:universal TRINITY_DN10231_c0_g1_i1:502-176(-)